MIQEYHKIVKELSRLHIVPYHKWNDTTKGILASVLGNIPFFITRNGNIFLGEDSPEKIKNNKVCLQAHLDHPGGRLYYSEDKGYMYSKLYGHRTSRYLIGRSFGVFSPGISESLKQLAVEHCHSNGIDGVTLFFKADDALIKAYNSGELVVHYDGPPLLENDILANWNLDNILNAALVIYLLIHENYADKYYGLLTLNEEVGHSGLYEFLNIIFDKELYFISMDAIHSEIDSNNGFGIRTKQNNVELDKLIPEEVMCQIDEKYKAEIPFGACEGVTMVKENRPSMSLFVKINNFHNGIPFKKFGAEKISISLLKEYTDFVKTIANKIENALIDDPISANVKKSGLELNISITNHSDHIKDIILGCDNYIDYLTKGLPELRNIFSIYGLDIPNLDSDSYYKYKKFLSDKKIVPIDKSDLIEISEYLSGEIEKLFGIKKDVFLKDIDNIEIVRILLGNFNACNWFKPNRLIMLSDDKIADQELLRLITHELTHFMTAGIWRSMNMPHELAKYYDEGLAVYLSAKKFDIEIQKSLGFTNEVYDRYLDQKYTLEKWFSDFCKGNFYKIYKGNIHEYFIKNDVPHPFYANQSSVSRYGYFLSALETKRFIEEGDYYEKLLC